MCNKRQILKLLEIMIEILFQSVLYQSWLKFHPIGATATVTEMATTDVQKEWGKHSCVSPPSPTQFLQLPLIECSYERKVRKKSVAV